VEGCATRASANDSLRPTNAQHTHSGGKTIAAIPVIFQHLGECDDGRELARCFVVLRRNNWNTVLVLTTEANGGS